MLGRALLSAGIFAVAGCSGEDSTVPEGGVDAGDPGPKACVAGETPIEGGCRPAGIPPELCGVGFEPDGAAGCRPVLPTSPCEPGLMAVPGDVACREIAPCGTGTWGDIPVEPSTQHVDAGYVGGGSDGTAAAPWTAIAEGVAAAEPDAIVAVAAGSYSAPQLALGGKSVRVWGRCPESVEIVGTEPGFQAVLVSGSAPIELHQLAVTGPEGIGSTAANVLMDRVWVHDTRTAIAIQRHSAGTVVTIRDSLVEAAEDGVIVSGSTVSIERTVVRDALDGDGVDTYGSGVWFQQSSNNQRSFATVTESLIERVQGIGVQMSGSDVTVESTVVRDVLPLATDQTYGRGVNVLYRSANGEPSNLVLRSSVVETTREGGVIIDGSTAIVDATVVRNGLGSADDEKTGIGLQVQVAPDGPNPATLTITSSLVEQNHTHGVVAIGAEAIVDSTVIRDTQPRAWDQRVGSGAHVRDNSPVADGSGQLGALTIRGSVIAGNHGFGVMVGNSSLVLESSVVEGTLPEVKTGWFGDGIIFIKFGADAIGTVTGSRLSGNVRAGIVSFSGIVTIGTSTLECNGFHLDGEDVGLGPYSFVDQGGNTCGCAGQPADCKVISASLQPPASLAD